MISEYNTRVSKLLIITSKSGMQFPFIDFKLFHISNPFADSYLCLILILSYVLVLNILVSLVPVMASDWGKIKLFILCFRILFLLKLIWFLLFITAVFDDLS